MLTYIDKWLDRITMYRLVIYFLTGLLAAAVIFSSVGLEFYRPLGIVLSAGYLVVACWVTNEVFGWAYKIPTNPESAIITGLILALIITPYRQPHDLIFLTAASGLAIASKYLLAIRGKPIFNPAAIAVLLTAVGAGQAASWWVGNKYLAPLVLLGGWLVVRKIERETMVVAFLISALASTTAFSLVGHHNLGLALKNSLLQSSLLFLAFVMLPEPSTSPTIKSKQWLYGILAGLLWPPQVHVFKVYSTPERALAVANVFAYLVNPKAKLRLRLKQKVKASDSVIDFIFQPERKLAFRPGQYMEWTLAHQADSRGRRRYFTLASSPTEADLRLGVKFFEKGSSFKKALNQLDETKLLTASQLGGSFTLPTDPSKKLAFIAGGIGVTPYRSMLKYLTDKSERRDIVMLYAENTVQDFAYIDVLESARKQIGTNILYVLSKSVPTNWHGLKGMVSAEMIQQQIPDYHERVFYVSGPPAMVDAIKKCLRQLGVPRQQIKSDFFPGYA